MIRGCATRFSKAVRPTCTGYSGSEGVATTISSHEQTSKSQYSSKSGSWSRTNYYWSGAGLGLAFGAAGVAYLLSDDKRTAHCGSADHWVYKPKSAAPAKSDGETQTLQGSDELLETQLGLPTHVPYLIIGAGTAAMAAYRAIRTKHADAKVLLVGEEEYKPYMRPPLSKDMWFTSRAVADENKFTTWSGRDRSIFFEKESYYCQPNELPTCEKGGVAVATGFKVVGLDTEVKRVQLSDGTCISYDKCLIATGGRPRNLPSLQQAGSQLMDKVTLFRSIDDFKKLDRLTDKTKSIVVIGGGFLGSELACALGKKSSKNGMSVTQVFPESGNMGKVLPAYLSDWTTDKVRSEHVTVRTGVTVQKSRLSDDSTQLELLLSDGSELAADHVLVAIGLEPNTELAEVAGLEVDGRRGGFLVNAELEAATDIWVAGDAACFYDVKLGRRRVEHHDHAVVSGRLAGENMTGASRRFLHQSMFWSDLGPDVGYEAIGLVDSELPTVSVFAKAASADSPAAAESRTGESLRSETEQNQVSDAPAQSANQADKYGKGVIFYMRGKRVVGVLCWNVFNKIGIARKIIKDGAEHEDLSELAKMFDLHENIQDASEE